MKLLIFFLLIACPFLTHAQQFWHQQVAYQIDVTLHDVEKTLDGNITIDYTNHSPDTLSFIWMHCWPNAFKNDRTAFTEQQLNDGSTEFYFSDIPQRGYINRLNFRVDGREAQTQDHPQYIDVIKIILPKPLPPDGHIIITTPFHVKLPYDFSHLGYIGRTFELTHWYPQPAIYDNNGWHPQPYLDPKELQGESGTFDVHITVPKNYLVSSSGVLVDTSLSTFHYTQSASDRFSWYAGRHPYAPHDTIVKKPLFPLPPSLLPAIGYNEYDHLMVGVLVHSFNKPIKFFAAPLYATQSHQFTGIGGLYYSKKDLRFSITAARFSTVTAADSNGHQLYGGFYKIAPAIKIVFPNARKTRYTALEWKTYLIGEKMLDNYVLKISDSTDYPTPGKYSFRYLNQLSLNISDSRVLYPYKAVVQLQQAASFYRLNFTGNYFFNYPHGGGLDLRLFGAKFGYLGSRSSPVDLLRFMPKLTAVRGDEDYTYSNYFIGRNEFDGLASQQIMDRDGDLHLRTDLFSGLQGRSDDWVASINFTTTLPSQIIPQWLPLKIFFDAGTYSDAWGATPPTKHFLYVSGFQLSLFHDVLRIYAPLVYSSDFSDQLRTVPDQNTFWKKLSFSIDLQNIDYKKLFGHNLPIDE